MEKGDVLHRLKIVEGHLKKIISMVENKEYCIDILNQSSAVQSALRKVDELILDRHLHTCVRDAFAKGQDDDSIEEIMRVFRKRS